MKAPITPLLLLLASGTLAHATTLAELAGHWSIAECLSPASLRETYLNPMTGTTRETQDWYDGPMDGEVLVGADFSIVAQTALRTFTLSATGTLGGAESGQVIDLTQNRLLIMSEGEPVTVFVNTGNDILLTGSEDLDTIETSLGLKAPASLDPADLHGDWQLLSLIQPKNLLPVGSLDDVLFSASAERLTGPMTFSPPASFSGLFSGTYTTGANGLVTVTSGPDTIEFHTNAGKDVLFAAIDSTDETELVLLAKKPATLTPSDLAGTWRLNIVTLTSHIRKSFVNTVTSQTRTVTSTGEPDAQSNERLTDLSFAEIPFGLTKGTLAIDQSGNFTGVGTGSVTVNPDQTLTLHVDGQMIPLHTNAGKTFIFGSMDTGLTHEWICLIKVNEQEITSFNQYVDLDIISQPSGLVLNWSSQADTILEQSTTLQPGSWSQVLEAIGQDNLLLPRTSLQPAAFYRVTQLPEEP